MNLFRGWRKKPMSPEPTTQSEVKDGEKRKPEPQDPELIRARQTINELERIADARLMAGLEFERDIQTGRR